MPLAPILLLFALPVTMIAGPGRYARLGDFDGQVEIQLSAADAWMPAERNLPLPESAWIRTGPDSRVEIELDTGGVWRLGPESQGGLSDYAQLSTGQRVTLLVLDRGLAYFTGESKGRDSLTLIVPGAQVGISKPARVRTEAQDQSSQVAVLQGVARFSSAAAEIDLAQGQTTRVEPGNASRFFLYREVAPLDADRWSAARDKALTTPVAALHVAERYGLADLDSNGQWIQTEDLGVVWQPKNSEGWAPYREGRWRWYNALGYTWVSYEAWGWLPYHYGRWTRHGELGWVWAPASNSVFKPGEVFWMRGARVVGWGPLASGEEWLPANMPAQYAGANLTFAAFQPDAPVIDPAGFEGRPKEPLKVMAFTKGLPSPAFYASRLDAVRPLVAPLVASAGLRVAPDLPVVTQKTAPAASEQRASQEQRVPPPRPIIIVTPPPPPPEEVIVPVPEYVGAVFVTPPAQGAAESAQGGSKSAKAAPVTVATAKPPAPAPVPAPPVNPPRRPKRAKDAGEERAMNQFHRDFAQANLAKSTDDLDEWSRRYPQSDFADDRLYDYMQVHSAAAHPDKVLEYGAALMAKNLDGVFEDQQTLGVLYLVTVNAAAIPHPDNPQRALGKAAAQAMMETLPAYFEESRRPAAASEADWQKSRRRLEAAARSALKALGADGGM
jgi:FecR protein